MIFDAVILQHAAYCLFIHYLSVLHEPLSIDNLIKSSLFFGQINIFNKYNYL